MSKYLCFCDGAFSSTRNQSGSGLVIFRDGLPVLRYSKSFVGGSNNTGEINAILLALKSFIKPVEKITIVTDSQYCLGIINKGYARQANQELWNIFDNEFARVRRLCNNIKFVWTPGHANDVGNTAADQLAVKASKRVIL